MSLELIIGCMFSGKSSELIKRIRKQALLGRSILVINHAKDIRYQSGMVVTHDQDAVQAVALESLMGVFDMQELCQAAVVFIDEGQFFPDLYVVVVELVETLGKHVIVSALDGTWERKPFEQVLQLIPFADGVVKQTALCVVCKDGTPAPFSMRTVNTTALEVVGGIDAYKPVCRKHYEGI